MGQTIMRLRSADGFTLIESIIAGLILAIAITGVVTVVSQSSIINYRGIIIRRAYQELESGLELKKYGSNAYQSLPGPGEPNDADPANRCDTLPDAVLLKRPAASDLMAKIKVYGHDVEYSTALIASIPAKKLIAVADFSFEGKTESCTLETIVTMTRY